MDDRWRFLYYAMTELRGHGPVGCAGKGKTGASVYPGGGEETHRREVRDAERTEVAKHP